MIKEGSLWCFSLIFYSWKANSHKLFLREKTYLFIFSHLIKQKCFNDHHGQRKCFLPNFLFMTALKWWLRMIILWPFFLLRNIKRCSGVEWDVWWPDWGGHIQVLRGKCLHGPSWIGALPRCLCSWSHLAALRYKPMHSRVIQENCTSI